MRIVLLVCLILVGFTSQSHARVFKLKEQTIGTYFGGTAGTSVLSNTAFSRTDVTIENKVDYMTSAEFGLMYLASRTWIRIGVELVRASPVTGAQATDTGGTVLYRVDSNILSWGPVINLEFPIRVGESSRIFLEGGIGYMKTTVKNDYHLTADGNALYGVADYAEEASSYSFKGNVGLGIEMGLADTATFVLTTGYRSLIGTNLKHERAITGIGGAINAGDTLRDNNGDRTIDMSGFYAGAAFRFYWNW